MAGALPLPELPPPAGGRELIVHVGDSKTGSTSIQQALAAGRARLPGRRLLYPADRNHMALAKTLGDPNDVAFRADRWGALRDRLARDDWDLAVLSSEQFEFYPPARLAAALEDFLPDLAGTARIVVYVRPHAGRLVANHAERLKLGFTFAPLAADLEVQKKRRLMFYADRLARWRRVFGERLVVRPFLREHLFRGDVVADFLRLAFRSENVVSEPVSEQNPALSMQDLSVFREIHMRLQARDPGLLGACNAIGWNGARFMAALPQAGAPVMPAMDRALMADLRETFAEDAARFDRLFWPVPIFSQAMAATPLVEHPQPVEASAWHPPATLRLVHGWADMLAHVLAGGARPFLEALEPR